ncbi:pleckstrin homology-like domain family B member 3 [Myxocyprinus asiaticus]|uniref:pleckstrin homology-like domain family B member 3 n=1 Tax=Myxocyprinus asiaticus TaxID=70543 RepID=UPI002222939D|nr:pleckstrin homology-like domain family B member 3 [Myxocyprinus asiaticus]XP_051575201.1 pleckstrin homology-like domain family B member 3 [Myxocyprinus asiaticus]XP_051575203.1 pleckstrin homology-like domain family B member 3 [Myxocyprinus asiaticus]XP_051575204.1 pleckstrin homology-like domain family B member 3 [Myxocyprinus asiaticus]
MPRHNNMDPMRSQCESIQRSPWIMRVAVGKSPASSGAESDTEGSSTESEWPCIKQADGDSAHFLSSPSMLQRRITELDQQREELKIELQLEVALLRGELQTEQERLRRHTEQLQMLQEKDRHRKCQRLASRQQERVRLEEERLKVEQMKRKCDEMEKLIPTQSKDQQEQMMLHLQQDKDALDAALRAFEDMEFHVLELESGVEDEREEEDNRESETVIEREISRVEHTLKASQERVQQLEKQLKEMEKERDKELNSLRQERKELLHKSQRILKEKKPLSDWSNITGSTPCVMSLSPLTIHRAAQESLKESSSLPHRRSSHRKVPDRPLSAQVLVRMTLDRPTSEALSPRLPNAIHRLSNGHSNGQRSGHSDVNGSHTPCNSANTSRAPSPQSLLDLVEMERKLREAKAERERLLKEREERRRLQAEQQRRIELNSLQIHTDESKLESHAEDQLQQNPVHSLTELGVPLSLTVNFDLRAHVEALGHNVTSCMGVNLSPRKCGGFLTKRGGRVKTWRRRWFIFDLDHQRLAYYTKLDEKKLKGVIYFQAIEEVYYDHLRTASTSPRPSLTFCVKTYERLFFLVAHSAEAMRIWMDVIVTATDEHCRY